MKKLIALLVCLAAFAVQAQTGRVYSVTTISNMFYTNQIAWSNNIYVAQTAAISNSTFSLSNMFWQYTNNLTLTTNLPLLAPGSNVLWLRFTNSVLIDVTNAAP
jgi:hypothetical protein